MSESIPKASESSNEGESLPMLEKINAALKAMGSPAQYLKVPPDLPEYGSLKGKRIVAVDDLIRVLENMIADLMVASGGNASAIVFSGGSADELAKAILSRQPDILVLDFNLSDTVKGTDVMRVLRERGFSGAVVGASSDSGRTKDFLTAGAMGTIDKAGWGDDSPVLALARLFSEVSE